MTVPRRANGELLTRDPVVIVLNDDDCRRRVDSWAAPSSVNAGGLLTESGRPLLHDGVAVPLSSRREFSGDEDCAAGGAGDRRLVDEAMAACAERGSVAAHKRPTKSCENLDAPALPTGMSTLG